MLVLFVDCIKYAVKTIHQISVGYRMVVL